MKTKQLFWGFFLLSLGIIFLLEKFTNIYMDWDFVWELWPLVLVFWGISVMTKRTMIKPIVSAIFGIFFAIILYGSIFTFSGFDYKDDGEYSSNAYKEEINSDTKNAELELNGGGGKFIIKGTSDKLVDILTSGKDIYSFYTDSNDSVQFVKMNMDETNNIIPHNLKTKLNIRLSNQPVWDCYFNIGASTSYFDFSEFKLRNLELNTGASKADITIGKKYVKTDIKIEMGAANIKIRIPKQSGCKVKGEMVLMSKHLPGFNKISSNAYESSNFDNSDNKIFIHINGGVAKFSIYRY